ncbi:PREDICTED: fibrocystin-like [Ceratotherium simum simum]|uniref:Fibrocystin-like n=1 Tax=Ceratotherium simum simum TaxID=73337 RepID=A0ABM1CEQ5_CERSS|nr:PREDICTED: fibrocystin-like [Ceratotherium simum simum]
MGQSYCYCATHLQGFSRRISGTEKVLNKCTFREEQKCKYRSLIQGYICKQTDQVILILDTVDATWAMRKLYPVVSVTSGFVDTFSGINANTPCSTSGAVSTFYSIVPTREITKVCFVDQTPQVLRFFLLGNKSTSKLLLGVFYHELQSPHVFVGESFIPPTLVQSTSSLLDEPIGSNYFSIMDNLLYVVLQGREPIEIRSGVSIHLALTVMFSILEEGWEIMILEKLIDFLQVDQNQIRLIHEMPGNEATLKAIADSRAKRKRNCPTVTCASQYRVGQRRPLMMETSSYRVPPPTTMEPIPKVMVIEIGDLPSVRSTGLIPSLSSNKLQNLAHQVIIAQQTGVLENVLNITIGGLLVTQLKGLVGYGNTSSFKTGNLIYTRPYALAVLVEPSDGEVGKELVVQPQLVFLDKQPTFLPLAMKVQNLIKESESGVLGRPLRALGHFCFPGRDIRLSAERVYSGRNSRWLCELLQLGSFDLWVKLALYFYCHFPSRGQFHGSVQALCHLTCDYVREVDNHPGCFHVLSGLMVGSVLSGVLLV